MLSLMAVKRTTTAYLRVSTGTQDLANQKLAILEYARRKKFSINEFIEVQISSRKKPHQRGIDGMLERLNARRPADCERAIGLTSTPVHADW
jgi:DNA invertase Pin-like site-specific DNA recombinase